MSKRVIQVSSSFPEVAYRFGEDGSGKLPAEVVKAESGWSFEEMMSQGR